MKLYEIGEEFAALETMLEEAGGELTPELEELLAGAMAQLEAKADKIGALLAEWDATAGVCKAEAKRLSDRAKAFTARSEKLKRYVLEQLVRMGRNVEGERFRFRAQPNGTAPALKVLVPAELLPAQFRTAAFVVEGVAFEKLDEWARREIPGWDRERSVVWQANSDALREALEAKQEGVEALVEQPPKGVHLRIE